jgi:hypothetical protein
MQYILDNISKKLKLKKHYNILFHAGISHCILLQTTHLAGCKQDINNTKLTATGAQPIADK